MRNIRVKKKSGVRIWEGFLGLLFLGIIILVVLGRGGGGNQNLDYKLGIIATDGIALVSISGERKMINELNLDKGVDVWIPGGLSWYNNTKVRNILEQEKKMDLAKDVFWYNFGFSPDKILVLNTIDQWKNDSVLIGNLGFWNWLRYKKDYGEMLLKREEISGRLMENELFLDEVMVRDFSESRLNNEEMRLSVFNNADESGLAGFMAKRLEWSGFSVVSADNNGEKIDKCLIVYGDKTDLNYGWKMINKIFDCDERKDETLSENELELYFGEGLASMINYSSYFK